MSSLVITVTGAGEAHCAPGVRHALDLAALAGRPDIARTMVERDMYLIIIGKDQLYTDMPEYRNRRNKDYLNERVRGTYMISQVNNLFSTYESIEEGVAGLG